MSNFETTAYGLISLGPENKEQISTFVNSIKESTENGDVDCLDLHIRCKAWIDALSKTIEAIESKALAEAQLHAKNGFSYRNAKIEIREVGSKWHFDKTNDFKLSDLSLAKQTAIEKEKERMDFLKTIKEKEQILNDETGELVTVYPAYKTSKTGLVITLM